MATERKRGDKGAARTELVAVRFDPHTKYLLELAARAQHRSVSSFVEEAVEKEVRRTEIGMSTSGPITLGEADGELWDVDEMDRFISLAIKMPSLLSYAEQKRWKYIREVFPLLQDGHEFAGDQADRELLRKHGASFQLAMERDFQPSELAEVLAKDQEIRAENLKILMNQLTVKDSAAHVVGAMLEGRKTVTAKKAAKQSSNVSQ